MTNSKMRAIVEWLIARLAGGRRRLSQLKRLALSGGRGKKTELLQAILDIEWKMFSRLRGPGASKNDHGERLYRTMRRRIHSVLPDSVLESYLEDLWQAQREGRNLIIEKFDRREGKRPPLKVNPLIPQIVELETTWKKEMDQKSPGLNIARDGEAFVLYITSELETYSDHTLELYHRATLDARKARRNLVEERYRNHSAVSKGKKRGSRTTGLPEDRHAA